MTSRASKKKKMIMEAALKCIITNGYRKLTLDDIAKEIGLSKTAVYYYFKSKEDIIFELTEEILLMFTKQQKEVMEQKIPLVDRLLQLVDYRNEFTDSMLSQYTHMLDDMFEVIPILRKRIFEHTAMSIQLISEQFELEYPDGNYPVSPVAFSAFFEFSHHIFHLKYFEEFENTRIKCSQEDIVNEFKNIIRKAMM
ncbi:MAG: TetR/AcrR family transcriptional regulator [Deltaproteobacteria bacterium]|nr:TetR/AcrR family transcriptional regulator [Deltaproteobacteria bacterium]